jgi:hypothetical protein
MAGEVALGLILLVMAFIIRTFIVMIDNGTFDRIIVRLNNYIISRMERNEREDI